MNALNRWSLLGVAFALASSLIHCSKSDLGPQPTVTEQRAQADIEFRLTKTQQIRSLLGSLQDTVRPFALVLHDFGKAVDLKVDQHPGSVMAGLLDRLGLILQGAVNGMVEVYADGSWVLEHPASLALLTSGQSGSCARSHIRLSGLRVPTGEQIVVALSTCASPQVFETLATVLVGANGTRLVSISSATFQNLQNQSLSVDPCILSVDASNNSALSCSSLAFALGEETVSIENLDFHTDAQGTHAKVRIGTAVLVSEPNEPIDVRTCAVGQSCGN